MSRTLILAASRAFGESADGYLWARERVHALLLGLSAAVCLVCGAELACEEAEASGWQRGVCTCTTERCPTGALWLCPEHRVQDDAEEAA